MNSILIIEDEADLLENLSVFLTLEDYHTYTASNGKDGVNLAFEKLPDLIICDINMPEMDGYQTLKAIRANPSSSNIPFIFLTARSEKSDFRLGMELGADDFISKPYTEDEIINAVKSRLEKRSKLKQSFDKEMDELRQNFVSTLPHELKTPLSVILAYSDILKKNAADYDKDEISSMAQAINDAGKRLHRLSNNYIFYISLSEFNTIIDKTPDNATFAAHICLEQISETIREANNKNNRISIKLAPADIFIAKSYFEKIIEEILDNSIKFSNNNTDIYIESKIENKNYKICFTNTGVEFTKEQINKIGGFMQFNRKYVEQQGLGLGLAIVKKILEIYNGDMRIESFNGHTAVSIILPLYD
jgi:signal transduction histidine kinase